MRALWHLLVWSFSFAVTWSLASLLTAGLSQREGALMITAIALLVVCWSAEQRQRDATRKAWDDYWQATSRHD